MLFTTLVTPLLTRDFIFFYFFHFFFLTGDSIAYTWFIYLFFDLCFTARQDFLINFEPIQSVGGAKTEDPREKPQDHRKQNFVCPTCPELGSNPQRWDNEQFRARIRP